MFLNILKRDLKRKKAMNIILLLFITLATMFVSSSVNNIINVTTALDNYFEMANVPDYFTMTIDKMLEEDVDTVLNSATSIESYSTEKVLFMSSANLIFEDENMTAINGTNMLQGDKELAMNYFLSDESILQKVRKGEVYLTSGREENIGLEIGDKIVIEIENVRQEFIYAGTFKDAALGSDMNAMCRYIISEEDFASYIAGENIKNYYGGSLYYIHTNDLNQTISELSTVSESFALMADRATLEFSYVFDMVVTGALLVVSMILILIALVVLRFTITFTLAEEFREIGVMKAIGISNWRIRRLYLVKYTAISVIGALIGLAFSFPFGEMLMSVSSKSIIISGQTSVLVNVLCAPIVIGVVLLFCYGCTSKVKKMTPIDAIRNGQTGERFEKKSIMNLKKSKLSATTFLAVNDIVSSPKRYSIITLTFFLCLTLILILSATVSTMKSGTLVQAFGYAEYDVVVSLDGELMEYMIEGGRERLKENLDDMEKVLGENGIPAICSQEIGFSLPVIYGDKKINIPVNQGTGTTMERYEYIEGIVPLNPDEIAITRISADKLNVNIGDTVTIKTIDGEKEYIITAFFQTMFNMGDGIRLHDAEEINYIQAQGGTGIHILFTDHPKEDEITRRMDQIKELYPECYKIDTCENDVANAVGVTDTINAIKSLVVILTVVLTALITVLMERSFIAKEQGEIALMKAIGTGNGKIYAYHTLRFLFVGMIAITIGEIFAMPLTHLCIDPIFKMMGMELAVDYVINPVEMYLIMPLVILVTTCVSAFLTSLNTRKIKSSDTVNIE